MKAQLPEMDRSNPSLPCAASDHLVEAAGEPSPFPGHPGFYLTPDHARPVHSGWKQGEGQIPEPTGYGPAVPTFMFPFAENDIFDSGINADGSPRDHFSHCRPRPGISPETRRTGIHEPPYPEGGNSAEHKVWIEDVDPLIQQWTSRGAQ